MERLASGRDTEVATGLKSVGKVDVSIHVSRVRGSSSGQNLKTVLKVRLLDTLALHRMLLET